MKVWINTMQKGAMRLGLLLFCMSVIATAGEAGGQAQREIREQAYLALTQWTKSTPAARIRQQRPPPPSRLALQLRNKIETESVTLYVPDDEPLSSVIDLLNAMTTVPFLYDAYNPQIRDTLIMEINFRNMPLRKVLDRLTELYGSKGFKWTAMEDHVWIGKALDVKTRIEVFDISYFTGVRFKDRRYNRTLSIGGDNGNDNDNDDNDNDNYDENEEHIIDQFRKRYLTYDSPPEAACMGWMDKREQFMIWRHTPEVLDKIRLELHVLSRFSTGGLRR